MAAQNSLLPIRHRELTKNIVVAGKGGAVARRAIMDHLEVKQIQLGGGCLYIDTRGDASALLTMRNAMGRLGKSDELRYLDMTAANQVGQIHMELPTLMGSDQSAYLWMPLERMRERRGEVIARVAAGLATGFALRHEQLFSQDPGAHGPAYLVADASDDSTRVFWDLCGRGKAARGANCGLATRLPSLAVDRCHDLTAAAEILEMSHAKVEVVQGEGDNPADWRVRISHEDRHLETRYPGFILESAGRTPERASASKGWLRSLIGG